MNSSNLFGISFLKTILLFSVFFQEFSDANASDNLSNDPIIDFYDDEAIKYDEGYSTPLCKAEDKIIVSLIKSILIDKKVLDVGCGTGVILNYMHIEDYLGIDISPNMIKMAQVKFPNNLFIVGNMEEVVKTIDSNSFDCIICLFGPISYAQNPVDLLNEFYRILVPGGKVVFMPYTKRLEHQFIIGGYNTSTQDCVKRTYYSSQMVETLMSETPFIDVEIRGINYFGNVIEAMDAIYGNENSDEFYFQLLLNEQNFKGVVLPIEYARHSIVIAKK